MSQNSSIMRSRSQLDDLINQFKDLPANNIEQGQTILDKFTNSRLTSYLTNQDVRQINQSLRSKRSVGINFGLFREKKLGDLYSNLQEFEMQQQYHSQGFKQKKQSQRRIQARKRKIQETQRLAREQQLRIAEQKRLEIQRLTAQSKIVDTVLKLPTLPEKINFNSLVSMTYFQNYKGFNSAGSAPGKNILNIGEQHYAVDNGFSQFVNLLDTFVAKNKFLHECLDFVYESGLENINNSPLFQKQGLEKIRKPSLTNSHTLGTLRNFFSGRTIVKGFRAHHTDTRLGFEGMFASLITISDYFDLNVTYNGFVLKYIYGWFYGFSTKTQVEMYVFNKLLAIDVDNVKKINKTNQTLKFLQKLNRSEYEKIYGNSNYDSTVSYFKRELFKLYFNHSSYKSFIVSIQNFVNEAVGQKLKQNRNNLDENDMTKVNREKYYEYLEQKGSDRNSVENEIFRGKKFDLKFRKQVDYLDTRYFKSDPKETIMLYYYDHLMMTDSSYFYDISTVCRVFRKFDQSKYRYTSCDQDDKSMSNVIIYSGNAHTQRINEFLQLLPLMEVDYGTLDMDKNKNKNPVRPVLSFGDVGESIQKAFLNSIDYDDENFSSDVEIPTNFDYFDYNKKIIQKLKNDYNVKQYTQLSKAIQQEEERKKQQQAKRKEEQNRK